MTKEIIALALEAGAHDAGHSYYGMSEAKIVKFYTLSRADLKAEVSKLDVLLEECKMDWSGDVTQLKAEHKHEVDALRAENENLRTVMMAAAVEITEHWDAHCDDEGYGPANLLRRLENGYPAQYGYDAQSYVRLEKERDALRAELGQYPEIQAMLMSENKQLRAENEKLKADNLDLRSDEALNEAEALIRQAGAALLPHKSTVLRWYTPVDAALDAINEYFK